MIVAGNKLEIEMHRSDAAHQYVQSFALNGKYQGRAWFHHSEIAQGGRLTLIMGANPNLDFGGSPADAPPSLAL